MLLRLSLGVTKKDKNKNEHIKGILKLDGFGQTVKQLRLRLYGHVKCLDVDHMWAERCWRCRSQEMKMSKTKEEVFWWGKGGHAGGRSEGKCLTEVLSKLSRGGHWWDKLKEGAYD